MSWDKHTINNSSINYIIDVLNALNMKYTIEKIGCVQGYDDLFNDDVYYDLYELKFIGKDNKTIIKRDQMIRTYDCDSDDVIQTKTYVDKEPTNKKLEIYIHDDNFECDKNCSCKS